MHNGTFYINNELRNLLFFIELISSGLLMSISLFVLVQKIRKKIQGSFVFIVAFSISFVLLCDVGAIASAGGQGVMNGVVSYASNYGYFFFNDLTVWAVIYYLFEVIRKNGGTVKHIWYRIIDLIMIFAAATLAINNFTGYIFYFDEYNYYQRGSAFLFSQIPAVLGLIVLVTAIIKYMQYMTGFQRITISSCVALPTIAEILQIIIYGFSWLALSMDIACFLLITQYMTDVHNNANYVEKTIDKAEAKKTRVRLVIIAFVSGALFFSAVTKITVGVAADQVETEAEAHYNALMENASTNARMWLQEEYQFIKGQKDAIEIIGKYDIIYLTNYLRTVLAKQEENNISDVYFVNTNNEMASGNGFKPESSIDLTKRDWFVTAAGKEGICFNQPYKDLESGEAIVTLSTAVYGKDQRLKGVLAVDIFVDRLCDTIMNQKLPEDSYMIILDSNHNILAYPGYEFEYDQDKRTYLPDIYPEYQKVKDYIHTNDENTVPPTITDYDGVKRAFYVKEIPHCDWYIIAAISEETKSITERTLMESITVALVVYLVMGIIVTLWVTNNVIQKFRVARLEANAASEAKSSFLANMSHEIRTPINAVLGMDEVLLRECKDDNIREYALNIQSAGQSLLSIINEILDFSKIESGKLEIINSEYSLIDLVSATKTLIEYRAKEKNLEFTMERSEYLPTKLIGDENRIRQVMTNLLTNAVKYTKEGSITLAVKFERSEERHGVLYIIVKDTGMGISDESMEVLFDSFQRVDEDKNRNIEGTGLGLAITKQLVELMKGHISVESEYGKGSVFTAAIPQIIKDGTNIEQLEQVTHKKDTDDSGEKASEEVAMFEGIRALVVDDVSMNIKVFKGLLKSTGITIDSALSGDEAIGLIRSNEYDIIFLDHMMPEKDGIETFKELNANYSDRIKDVPVIMLTANAIAGVESEYLDQGFNGYLSKPVQREKLIECIGKIVERGK